MNLRNVLRAYSHLRQLTDDESALLETLRAMNDSERELLVESLQDKPVTKKGSATTRVYEHCAQCDKTKGHSFHKDSSSDGYHEFQPPAKSLKKSPRAASLQQQIQSRASSATGTPKSVSRCTYKFEDGGETCEAIASDPIHDQTFGYAGYHPFQPAAQPAPPSSTPASSEMQQGDAGDAHHVASGGD